MVKSHQPSTHSNTQNRRRTENEVGRAMKSFCPSLGQRQDQLLTMNSNLQMVRKLCFTYTLCPCYQEKSVFPGIPCFQREYKRAQALCLPWESVLFLWRAKFFGEILALMVMIDCTIPHSSHECTVLIIVKTNDICVVAIMCCIFPHLHSAH